MEAEEKRAREERLRRAEEVRAKRKQEEARKKVRISADPALRKLCARAPGMQQKAQSPVERRNSATA